MIQSDESRKQTANVESCFEKLHQLLRGFAKETIPGETSEVQKDRVRNLYELSVLYFWSMSIINMV